MIKEETNLPEWFSESMVRAKVYVGLTSSMLSYMFYRCKLIPTIDPSVKTAGATVTANGNEIYINVEFWETLTDKQRAFLLLHEVLHIFLDHITRSKDNKYSAMLWNVATDYHINLICSGAYLEDGVIKYNQRYTKYSNFIEGGLLDTKYVGMSSDEIYHKLLDENDGIAKVACESALGDDIDEYADNMDIIPTDIESKQIQDQVFKNKQTAVESVINANGSSGIGENEMDMVRVFENLVKPKISWVEHLSNIIVKNEQTWTTYMNYNHLSGQVIFPSYEGNTINVVFGIDTSGSMSPADINRAVSELYGLLNTYDSWKIHLISCDTKAHVLGIYTSEDGHGFEDFDLKLIGGGGTYMSPMVQYASDVGETDDINCCIILSDGHLLASDLKDDVDFGVVVVITDNGNQNYYNDNVEVLFVE